MSAEDPEEAQDRDRAAEEALGRDLERDRGPAEEKHQGLLNSFRVGSDGGDGRLPIGVLEQRLLF